MLSLISVLVGIVFLVSFSLLLWYMLTRPTNWSRFTEAENAFWVKRGFPVKWAGAIKECEQGWGFKVLIAFCIFMAAVLTITPFLLPLIFPHHG
jgi:hypothetical protein